MVKKKKNRMSFKQRLLLSGGILSAAVFISTTILFLVGMMPTIVARIADRSYQKTRVLTIGFMNFSACFPFWFKLVQGGATFDVAVEIIRDPMNISIMYGGAVIGYMIEWTLAGAVAAMMVQKGRKRLEDIKKYQQNLIDRWGPEVAGDVSLDSDGFPIENPQKPD